MNYDTIIAEFNRQYGYLRGFGLRIRGIANLIDKYDVISISTPFIFDRAKLPHKFMGLDVRDGINESDLPSEFRDLDPDKDYIWAYQRFENYVDNHATLIRNTLGNQNMTRGEMLDALCFGDFNKHKAMCIEWHKEGKIPDWKEGGR